MAFVDLSGLRIVVGSRPYVPGLRGISSSLCSLRYVTTGHFGSSTLNDLFCRKANKTEDLRREK